MGIYSKLRNHEYYAVPGCCGPDGIFESSGTGRLPTLIIIQKLPGPFTRPVAYELKNGLNEPAGAPIGPTCVWVVVTDTGGSDVWY